jgi:amino acid transporter/nucleotide-binding universal stress UspA family protein
MDNLTTHRPRNLGWARASALLYGDWGTSKAYVIGLAFVAAGFSSFPIILAVCLLTGLVGYNYIIVCRHFPDGGGVYSAAREQSRVLAVLGSLLLLADFIVTASMSCWDAMSYFGVPHPYLKVATIGFILVIGAINYFGPKHSGSFAFVLAIPTVIVVIAIIVFSIPYLTFDHLQPPHTSFGRNWVAFVGVILALSGVEAIANLTGVMKLDTKRSTPENPSVRSTSTKAILPVAIEVVIGTALLGWAMLSLPLPEKAIDDRWEDMLRLLGEHYSALTFAHYSWGFHFGQIFGVFIGIVVGLLLLSAVNTAIGAMIGLMYMLARDKEMPHPFTKLNTHGVPWLPLGVAILLPAILVILSNDLNSLADMYAIGVVGAITVNLGSCCFNQRLGLDWREKSVMMLTFIVLFAVEITIAKTKPAALFFATCVLGAGFALRWWAMKRAGFETVIIKSDTHRVIRPELNFKPNLNPGQSILVAARGFTPVLCFAVEEAKLRKGNLYVLYVKELAVAMPGPLAHPTRPKWQDDPQASEIMYGMFALAQDAGISVLPVYAVSENPAVTIVDLAATLGVDILMLGSSHRQSLAKLLKGNVVTEVAKNLPENIQMIIHS